MSPSERTPDGRREAVPILTYHSLDPSGSVVSLAPDTFARQMRDLRARGYTGISLDELLRGWDGRGALPKRPVVLTFDDGFANVLDHAAPVLDELRFRATVYAITDLCGGVNDWAGQAAGIPRLPLLTWEGLGELASAGFEVGAHTATHRVLTRVPGPELEGEIVTPKAVIEDRLGVGVASFAYPFGAVSPEAHALVARHYPAACGTGLAFARPASDRHRLPRVDMYYFRNKLAFRSLGTPAGTAYLLMRGVGARVRPWLIRPTYDRSASGSGKRVARGAGVAQETS